MIICNDIKKIESHTKTLKKIYDNSKYVIINSDINIEQNCLIGSKKNIITYGMNQKATITLSSINDNKLLISIQRNIENIKGEEIEVGENVLEIENEHSTKINDMLAIFATYSIYT